MANKKYKIKRDDEVIVIAGNSKGQKGKVKEVLVEKDRVVVEGVNMISKHIKPSAANPQGGIEKVEGTIHISNVKLIDPKTGEPTRVGRKKDEDGTLKRVAKKTGEFI